jgi:hypothetical protein
MRTTIDLPDDLFRRAKSEAALRGKKFKDLVEEGLRLVIQPPPGAADPDGKKPRVSAHDLLKDLCGIIEDGPDDLATNKKYLDDFGR